MIESEFNALIHLLEDDDPEVSTQVETALLNMGVSVVPRLEAAWGDVSDEIIQQRLEDIIRLLQSKETLEAIQGWKQEGGKDILYGWYLITRYRFPNIDYTPLRNRISRLINKAFLEIEPDMSVPEKCMVLNRLFFQDEGFKADRRNPLGPENHFLHQFLDRKRGGPLSLGLLYLVIAQSLELPLQGITLPNNYFIIRAEREDEPFYIDVFNKGAFFSKRDLSKFLQEHDMAEVPEMFQGMHPFHHILAVINIIITGLRKKKDQDGVNLFLKLIESW